MTKLSPEQLFHLDQVAVAETDTEIDRALQFWIEQPVADLPWCSKPTRRLEMDRDFQEWVLLEKVNEARSNDARIVCKSILAILEMLASHEINDESLLVPLETAFQVSDDGLGFGEVELEGAYATQVRDLIDDFVQKAKKLNLI